MSGESITRILAVRCPLAYELPTSPRATSLIVPSPPDSYNEINSPLRGIFSEFRGVSRALCKLNGTLHIIFFTDVDHPTLYLGLVTGAGEAVDNE